MKMKLRRRSFFGRAVPLGGLTGLLVSIAFAGPPPAPKARPNLLLVTIDTLRPDRLGCYDPGRDTTPNIDALAARAARFERAFAHTPTTLPSHTSILLGLTPVTHGVHDNHNFIVRDEFLSLAEHLKKGGYATGAFVGAFPLDSRFGLTQGFDVYDDNYGTRLDQEFSYVERRAEAVVAKALEWLAAQTGPWFLWVHCFDPHQKYDPPEPFRTRYKGHLYDGEVAYVDAALKPLLDLVGRPPLADKTLVVLTGDHGESLGEHGESTHGYFAYNSTLRVPLLIAAPGAKAVVVGQNVCHIDIFPTVCDLLGLAKPPSLQGASLVAAMAGKPLPPRDIYVESLYPFYSRGWAPLRGFIGGRDKYLDSPIPELYDLAADFDELRNLAAPARIDPLRARLAAIEKAWGASGQAPSERKADRETLQHLKSLGYLASPQADRKGPFTADDDLKTLLPFQNRLMQAMGAYHNGDLAGGARLLQGIIEERKDFDLAYTYLATLYKEQRRFKEAVDVLRQGYQYCPKSYKVITTFGIILTEVGEYDAALGLLDEGLAIIDYDPEIWNYKGVAYWKKGEFDKALDAYEKCLALDGNYPVAFNNVGSVYLSLHLKTREAGALDKAVESFRKAIALDPRYASAWNGLGGASLEAGRVDEAVAAWERTVELDPDYASAYYNLGLAYVKRGELAKALAALEKYKAKVYPHLPAREQQGLDELIGRIRKALGERTAAEIGGRHGT
jgi:arylsulfatase A-like enzyme/Flp pilus assembly protein TadD